MGNIRLWMSGEIQLGEDVHNSYRLSSNIIEKEVNEYIKEHNYGNGLKKWAYLSVILGEEIDPYYPEVKRYRKRKKEVEFRLKIDQKEFIEGDRKTHLKLLAQSLLRSLELMKDMQIKDFDLDSLTADVIQCLSKYLLPESNGHLEFWMFGSIQNDAEDAYHEACKLIEAQVKQCIGKRNYGDGLQLWVYIALIHNKETDPYHLEAKRYVKGRKEVEFQLKVDHGEFIDGNRKAHLRLLARSVLRSLELMKDMNIGNIDLYQLTVDVRQCLSKYL